jgi:alkanesulfonate monooxygenase SsuD/methylene tetrahydromethanopterin reductase-like flavin-dependent oxidoreductase (luciferase family)
MEFFACVNPILGRTKAEAEAKYKQAMESADVIGALAQFSGYTGIDMSVYPLDEEFVLDTIRSSDNAVQSFIGNFPESVETVAEPWTPRRLGAKIAIGVQYVSRSILTLLTLNF